MDLSKIIDFIKQPLLVFGMALSTGIILFLPSYVLQILGLIGLLNSLRPYFGILFIISTIYCLIYALSNVWDWIQARVKEKGKKQLQRKYLETLTEPEREILADFINYRTRTQRLDIDSGVVNGLVSKGIISRASTRATAGFMDRSYYDPVYSRDHNLSSWAWEYLNIHKELLNTELLNTKSILPDDVIPQKWLEWFKDVEYLEAKSSQSDLSYQQLITEKYRQQGLDL